MRPPRGPSVIVLATGILSLAVIAPGVVPVAAPFVAAGTFLSLVLTLAALTSRWSLPGALPLAVIAFAASCGLLAASGRVPLPLIAPAAIAVVLALPLARSGRSDLALLGPAAAVLVLHRHLTVASGLAPDHLALASLLGGLALIAARGAGPRAEGALWAGSVVLLAAVGLAYVAGSPYGSDAVVAVHRAAEHLLAGRDPYQALDVREALARFGAPASLTTELVDGTPVWSLNYPPLAFLVPAPLIAVGLPDVRVLYLAELCAIAVLALARSAPALRPYVAAVLLGNVALAGQFVQAGVDPLWALLVLVAFLFPERRAVSALALGLAVATRQPAWVIAPFYVAAAWRRWGSGEAARRAVLAALAAGLPQVPFAVHDAAAWAGGVLMPVLWELEPHGAGLIALALSGLVPEPPRPLLLAAALVALAVAGLAVLRAVPRTGWRIAAVAPTAALWLSWRSLLSYFAFAGLFALVLGSDDRGAGGVSSPHERRSGAAGDPGVSGGQGPGAR